MIEPTNEMMAAAHKAYGGLGILDEAEFNDALRNAITAALAAQPQAMVPVKATLIDRELDVELGVFSQGVHFGATDRTALLTMYDTAGPIVANVIARFQMGHGWFIEGDPEQRLGIGRLHVQAVALTPNEIALSDELASNAARIFLFGSHDDTPHDICQEIRDASKKLDTENIEVIVRQKRRPL